LRRPATHGHIGGQGLLGDIQQGVWPGIRAGIWPSVWQRITRKQAQVQRFSAGA